MIPISSTVKTIDNHLPVNTTSDLWLPSLLCVVGIVLVLSLRWLWFFGRVQQLQKKIKLNQSQSQFNNGPVTTDSISKSADTAYRMNKFRDILGAIGDLTAFTAQKNPIILEELTEKNHLITETTISTTISAVIDKATETEKAPFLYTSKLVSSEVMPDTLQDEFITTLVPVKVVAVSPPFFAHELFYYQARLTWKNVINKEQFLLLLSERPWQHSLPVCVCSDISNNDAIILGWQVIHRHELATIGTLNIFKEWCMSLANTTYADCTFITTAAWDNFIDEAHSLLAGLDGAIILKISVPIAQLDLFTQALLAARFVQQQEHWIHSDAEQKNTIVLERLWQTVQATHSLNALTEYAIFQLIIDLPHFDVLEARKIYMRIRAVTKTSTATLQSVNGLHLSEGMLDKYSREMILKQESLTQAGLIPGSKLAQGVFSPKLKNNYDLYHSSATI